MGLVYRIFLPPISDVDVVNRVLEYSFDGLSSSVNVSTSSEYFDLPPVKELSSVGVRLKDVDDAGNESDWSESLVFVAKDTLVPPAPGGLSTKLVAEVADAPVEVVIPPSPAPEPEVSVDPPNESDDTDTDTELVL